MKIRNYLLRLRSLATACLMLAAGFALAQTANWTAYKPELFPTNASGQIHGISRTSQLKFHPSNAQKMYAVSARGGLFISTNGGNNWSIAPGCDNLPLGTRFASVCIDHTDDQVIYLGGGDRNYYSTGSGVWKSVDGGQTFSSVGPSGKIIAELIMDPTNRNVLVAATNTGIYKTTNGGSSWTLKTSSIAFIDMKAKEGTGSRVLFASTRGAELYRSQDFGETWTQITNGIYLPTGYTSGGGTRIGVTPADTNVVYFYMNAKGGTLFRSNDGGTSFTNVKDNLSPYLTGYTNSSADAGQGDYNTGLGVDRTNPNIIYFVAHVVWKSTNGGVSWTQLTDWWAELHTDMHQMVTSPYNNNQLWNMNDGGVWLSTDGGSNWTPKSDGIYGIEIYHGGTSPTRRDMVSIGTQDNGELYGNSTGWFTNRGGDWQSHCVFDYRPNSSMVYYFLPDWGTVQVPKRRIVTGGAATYGLPSSVTDFSDICYHRSDPNIGFVGSTIVYRTQNLTATTPTWTSILNPGVKIMAMHVHFADPNRLYVVTNDGKIHVSTNAQDATPTFTTYTLPGATSTAASITSITADPDVVYVTANTNVYRSTNNGATWTAIKYNLPSYNHAAIIADEYFSNEELVFVATGGTVYYKTKNATTWTLYSSGLPPRTTIVDMSIFNDGSSNTLLRAFTYGRGVWETPITNLRTMTANFAADKTQICPGGSVTFSDLSTGNVTSRTWSFPGGTPSTSTATNPTVTYSNAGTYSVTLTVSDGSTNSVATRTDYISTNGLALPVTETFEAAVFPPDNWTNIDAGSNGGAWQQYNGAGGFGQSTRSMYFPNYSVDAKGDRDELRSATIGLQNIQSPTLTFDVAYHPYSTSSYLDTLEVLISTNCGTSYTNVYRKWGSTLSTVAGTNTNSFEPTATQWRKETINLNAYVGQNIVVAIRNIGRYGNNIYIDNIEVKGTVPCALTLSASKTDASCAAASNGSVTAIPSGGNGTVTFTLTPGSVSNTTGVFNGLASGSYTVSATDANGCTASTTANVANANTLAANATAGSIDCFGGSSIVTVTATGGTAPYSGTGEFSRTAGTYTFTVTDANGCSATTSVTITQPAALSASASATDILTTGGTSTVTVTATGGTSPYTGTGTYTRTAGTYTFTVTDANGCTATASVTITEPTGVIVTLSAGSIACHGGSADITVSATNGTAPYTGTGVFTRNAGSYSFTVTDANGATGSATIVLTEPTLLVASASSGTISCNGGSANVTVTATGGTAPYSGTGTYDRSAGTYSFTVTDAKGCTATTSATLTEPTVLQASTSATAVSCFGGNTGSATVSPTGGTTPYNYLWSNGAVTAAAGSLTAGSYSVTITDAKGCSATASATVTQPTALTASATASNIACLGGSATVTVAANGGVAPYSGTGSFTRTAGTYSFTVTDANGCSATTSVTLTQPNAVVPTITASGATTFCEGSSVTLSTGSYASYAWSTGATTGSINVTTSGSFTVTVTDGNGCVGASAATSTTAVPYVNASISISSNAAPSITATTSVTFTATHSGGGTVPSFQWKKNGNNVGTNSSTYTNNSWVDGDVVTCVMTSNAPCVNGSPATSNAITMTVNTPTVKFVVADITANKAFYYDQNFAFVQANNLSTTVLNGKTNVADLAVTTSLAYILDGSTKRVYRSTGAGLPSTASRILYTNAGKATGTPTGIAVSGDTLWVLDKKNKAIFRYSLTAAFNGTGTINALQKISLSSSNSAAESLVAYGGFFYVLNNGTTRTVFRYPKTGGTAVVSRAMVNVGGTSLSKACGMVLDAGTTLYVTDAGLDRALEYPLASLYSGSGNLSATKSTPLNSANLNSTGIALASTPTQLLGTDPARDAVRNALPGETDTPPQRPQYPGATEPDEIRMSAYPNPSTGVVNLRIEGRTSGAHLLTVFDLNGRRVAETLLADDDSTEKVETFDLSYFGPGIYWVVLHHGDYRQTLQVTVQ